MVEIRTSMYNMNVKINYPSLFNIFKNAVNNVQGPIKA